MKWNIIFLNQPNENDSSKFLHCQFHHDLRLVEIEGVWRCPHCGSRASEEEMTRWKAAIGDKDPSELAEQEKGVLKPRISKNKGPMVIGAKTKKKIYDELGNILPDDMRDVVKPGEKLVRYQEFAKDDFGDKKVKRISKYNISSLS